MIQLRMLRPWAIGLLICASCALARAQEGAPPFRYETQQVDRHEVERAAAVAAALDFAAWPETSELYVAPAVSRALFREPAGVSEEVRACTTVAFGDEPWPQCTWSWQALSDGRKPSPEDWLDLQITVAPSGRAAQEHLISSVVDNQMPTEGLVRKYKAAQRAEALGDVAFVVQAPKGPETTASFLRGNVAFRIRGHGKLAAEVLPLAARLDERLAAQQPLTLEELRARTRAPAERSEPRSPSELGPN
jgi:hypothetical protein